MATVPSEDFYIESLAQDGAGHSLTWRTDTYTPQTKQFEIYLDNAVVTGSGQQLKGIVSGIAQESGEMVVRIFPPQTIEPNWQIQRINVTGGKQFEIPFELKALGPIQQGKGQLFVYLVSPSGKESIIKTPLMVIAKTN